MTWILLGIGLVLVYWLFWRAAPPTYYRGQHQADIPQFIQSAFAYLRPGGVVHITHEGSARRLRLRKVYLAGQRHGVRFELPEVPGAASYHGQVEERLKEAGFRCKLPGPIDRMWPAQDHPLLVVDSLTSIDAFRAIEVAREAMGLNQDARYTIHLEGIPSPQATREYLKAR